MAESGRAVLAPTIVRRVVLTFWSAGYGSIRAILSAYPGDVAGVILLDCLHTDYVPEGLRLADGGVLNDRKMLPFKLVAERAERGETRMIVTHSEIFPGTYGSMTGTGVAAFAPVALLGAATCSILP